MAETINWGILGTGNISSKFAGGLSVMSDARLLAVGSRGQDSADRFGDRFGAERRYDSYEALAADPDIDAVYIGTPHPYHKPNALLCLQHGKAVLVEKPFAMNTSEAEIMVQTAREKNLYLMEAMWTRYLPIMVRVRQLLAEGAIGEVRMLHADFGFRTRVNPQGRLFDPDLGGGALLDVGIYPLSLASMIFGQPSQTVGLAHLGETGVDENTAILLSYEGGALAVLSCAIRTSTPHIAIINGTQGRITIPTSWWYPTRMTVEIFGKETAEVEMPLTGNGYNYEAAEVGRCLRAGLLESDIMPLEETLSILRTMDYLRQQWGLTYPMEKSS